MKEVRKKRGTIEELMKDRRGFFVGYLCQRRVRILLLLLLLLGRGKRGYVRKETDHTALNMGIGVSGACVTRVRVHLILE